MDAALTAQEATKHRLLTRFEKWTPPSRQQYVANKEQVLLA